MNILLVSQCNKKALIETRRVIDQFAERRGERTWQTPITAIGLTTLRKLLKKTARRNTAVACHWIRSKNHSELLWIVGNASKFNEQGAVPTNITRRDILKSDDENTWHTAEDIALLAGIGALFHDFGKANILFQQKLKGKGPLAEPYRHEWVSLRMFEAFVAGQTDQQWLTALSTVSTEANDKLLAALVKDHPDQSTPTPFNPEISAKLPPMARAVGWLILTHHKLPQANCNDHNTVDLADHADEVLDYDLHPSWNSPQIQNINANETNDKAKKWTAKQLTDVWEFKNKTPILSTKWRSKAQLLAKRALKRQSFMDKPWLDDTFSLHIARMVLMLADHHYSSLPADQRYQDKKYQAVANTCRKTGAPKQQLDEHLIGVYRNSLQLVRMLPVLKRGLSAIARHSALKQRSKNQKYQWQDRAFDVARSISEQSEKGGFFGINMASTGKGKTFANAKIMYGLANNKLGCRFSIALGLRTLTLQTGDALSERLKLDNDDIAVLIGSQSVKQLHDVANKKHLGFTGVKGSVSADPLFDEDQHVIYEGTTDGPLKAWLEKSDKANKLVNAPILVSTIDHLMPATESDRGGKQIAPMLRLLTADLVLDEIDDFDLQDLPAICRLVNWAGLLGSRVLLSSATLPPSLVECLFDAYASGRAEYHKVRGISGQSKICCAWFDEFKAVAHHVDNKATLVSHHQQYVDKRIAELQKQEPICQGKMVNVSLHDSDLAIAIDTEAERAVRAVSALANKMQESIVKLHQQHRVEHPQSGQKLSVGLVRMANINPLVAVAQQLFAKAAPQNTSVHYCVYHSRHPLVVRSAIEQQLDGVLKREDQNAIWQHPSIKQAIAKHPSHEHIFVVLASPVAEVGRDHDYDWAIVEPSSMRSIIQLAGRVQRHRNNKPDHPNIHILSHNYKGLKGDKTVFCKPGFESEQAKLASCDLNQLLEPEQYQAVNAISRVKLPELKSKANQNLAMFEHLRLQDKLMTGATPAKWWWQKPLSWSYEWQRGTRFRLSAPCREFVLMINAEQIIFKEWKKTGELKPVNNLFKQNNEVSLAAGVAIWFDCDYSSLIAHTIEEFKQDIATICIGFGAVSVDMGTGMEAWYYEPCLGIYQAL